MSFEKKIEELETLVREMEAGELPLEEGIALYEKGLELTKNCLKTLSENKGKIMLIRKEMDKLIEEPLQSKE